MPSKAHKQAWQDWGAVNPLYGILTDPRYRHGGDVGEFLDTGRGTVAAVLAETDRLGLCAARGSALDFGCGVGRLTGALSPHFERVTGVDVSGTMLETARKLHPDLGNCTFVLNDADDLGSFPDASFDLVLSLFVLQHLESTDAIETFLRELVRVLRPGGALVVQLPAKVPAHRPPLPPWGSRDGLRTRTAIFLRRAGVPPGFLYRRLRWVPEMTMTAFPDDRTRAVLEGAGAHVVHASPPDTDAGGTVSRTYYVAR